MEDCIFCKIVEKEVPSEVVYEDDEILAFKDINPVAPVHILVIPKVHISDMTEISKGNANLIEKMHIVALQIAEEFGIKESGFRLVNNCKKDGGQVVYHLHYHLIGGKPLKTFA